MFTYLWQCLAWLDPEVTQATVSPAIIMDNKKPSSVTQTGRRKSGGSTQLRSPIVKRPPMAPVSLQGWLHKQGSEGLMLWKKRWFVLSEYCLFYYKGPEEEKLLGSILLPSYKVSPCTADDKVYRKFAFKAEHANMRTYYFAAETRELMTQWMNALSLATILQEGAKLQSYVQPSVSSMLNQSEDSDSGFQGYRSRPITTQPTNQDGNMNGWAPPRNPYQPLYANAPPKPRRLNNEGQYGGSSPEASPDRREEQMMYRRPVQQMGTPNYHYHPGQRIPPGYPTLPNPDVIRSIPNTGTYPGGMPVERRTPDPFGRSNINTPVRTPSRGDYSDVYKTDSYNGGVYQRPEGPAHSGYVKTTNPPIVNYQHPNQYYQGYHQLPQMSSAPRYQGLDASSSNVISRRDRQPPRPHSADFLDYDAKRCYQYQEYKETTIVEKTDVKIDEYPPARPPRPKSSLDIMHTNDGYYWSEESYAEKMRQSAMYLQNTLPQRSQSQSSRSNTPNFKTQPKGDSVVMRQKTEGAKSPSRQNPRRWSEYNDRNGNQFVRSASARLPKSRQNDDESDEVQAYTGGEDFKDERKEESMKRLLEWKQRMLQSPLTRKPSGSSTRGASQNELSKYYKQQVLRELERQEAKSREELGKKRLKPDGLRLRSRSTDGRRSAMSSSNRYNSYSSDDEENDERRSRRSSQGGRPRKTSEESKNKKTSPDKIHYTSPDYENVAGAPEQNGYSFYPDEKNEASKSSDEKPMDDTFSKHSDSGYDTLKQADDISQQMLDLTKMTNFELNQPTLVYPVHNVKGNWNEKIDESKLIKEFSYQYIKDSKTPEKITGYKVLDSPPENIVKSRIKQLGLVEAELEGKEVMKEPLKVATPVYQTNEAHVSNLKNVEPSETQDRKNNKNLRSFALGDNPQKTQESTVKEVPEKHQKSVKDLLADFERKSQLAHERQALEHEKNFEDSPGKRYVFSDTETLLYDTSSDTDEKKHSPDPSILNSLRRPESRVEMTEEEDGDEEVAAALGRREKFFSSCRDLGRKRDPDYNFRGKKLKACANVEPSPSSEVETIMTPGYIRSSLTESMVAHENSDSTCSTPIIDQIKDNLQKTLPKENLMKSEEGETAEGHYMPMTPSRRVSAPSSDKSRSTSSLHSVLFGVEMEETYVEMAEPNQNMEPNKSFLSSVRKPFSLMNPPGYCEIPNNNESHYDYLYRATSVREPEYMEVNSLLEVLKEQDNKIQEHKEEAKKLELVPPTPPRSALPDILNSSTTSQPKSDSSDADDESSKDLDSLDTPRHPRFSLSDTFRPASYYLGNTLNDSRNLIGLPTPNENHDSSDSDLVSPPPIPTSPPPLDDLDTSLETESSLEIRDAPKLKISDKDLSKKLWSKPLDESKKLKRRPVSEDILESLEESDQSFTEMKLPVNDLDSIGSRSGVALDEENGEINLDQYLEDLQLTDSTLKFSENIYKSYEKEFNKNLMPKESVNKTDASEKSLLKMNDNFKEKPIEEVQYENLQCLFPPPPPELYNPEESVPHLYRNVPIADVPPPENYCDVYPEPAKVRFDPDTLQQQGEKNLENQGAPYYYSDIIKHNNDEEEFASSTSDRSISSIRGHLIQRYQPLNNQRENVHESNHCIKRNDIGRKVNPINQGQPSQQGGDLDDVQKITAELRTTSAHFMGAADKSGCVDVRNIYESDTLQRRKTETLPTEIIRVRTPDLHHPQGIARNLYPHGLRDKSSTPTILSPNVIPQPARSRSLEGLLNESGNRLTEPPPNVLSNQLDLPNQSRKDQIAHSRLDSSEGDDLWEEDALWRENLRRVSLRHTRSLDNLDDEVTQTNTRTLTPAKDITGRRSVDHFTSPRVNILPTGRRSVDHFTSPPRGRLSRDVTYVNDMFWSSRQMNLSREYEQDYREGRIRPKKRDDIHTVVELSDSGVLDCDDGIHYERLTRNTDLDRRKRGEMYLESYEWDEDRETFMRNRPEKEQGNNNQRQQQSFLGDGTPHPSQPPPPLQQQPPPPLTGLEPIDREKLRQWDLMSSGTVEQEADPKKEKKAMGEESIGKKLEEGLLEGDSGDFSTTERHAAKIQQMQEASASGSVMREAHLPRSMSTLSQGQQFQQRVQHQVTTPTIVLSKEESPTEKKINAHEVSDRRLDEFSERIDYYDRGKGYPVAVNGYSEWNDPYSDRKNEYVGGREYVDGYLDRRRAPENDYYIDQYQDHRIGGMYNRNCGTLPMAKSTSTVPVPSVSLQGSNLGRNAGTYDGRYVKDSGKRKIPSSPWGLDVSAGELLGRTHEELVLLLIQLRRQSAGVCKAMEACHIEIEAQARLAELETPKRMEHLQKLEELKKHLLDLEKQYEKGKPLVNLVDNMVKLGSLYRGNNHVYNGNVGVDHSVNVREKLEFNQKVQEQRLLAEERRDWDRLSPDHNQLQAKVQQLYRLDRLLQEESGTLQSLQQDKELLEKALGGLRHKLQINRSNPVEADRYRKQQKLLEKELSRVRLLLAHNSKKLEETVAENARLEQELVILRQKLQASRVSSRSSVPLTPESATLSTTAALEAELRRVQQLVGDLQRQRQELSAQVKQLTEKSDTLVQQIRPGPTGVAGAGPIPGKKKSSATWLETDLDLLVTQDVGLESPVTSPQHQPTTSVAISSRSTTPIYINTDINTSKKDTVSSIDEQKSPEEMISVQNSPSMSLSAPTSTYSTYSVTEPIMTYTTPVELSEADDRMKRFYGIIPREKQEIKTVRIVKRESERRQRDRDRSGNIGLPTTAIAKRVSVIEEDDGMLSRVEEESYENYSPNYNYDYQPEKTNGISGRSSDPYVNFHPTNPFLPQNLGNINNLEELTSYDPEPMTSQNQRSMSLPRGFGKSPAPVMTSRDSTSSLRNMIAKRNRVRFENQYQEGSGSESGPNSPRNESPNRNYSPSQGGFVSNRIYPKGYGPCQRPFSPNQTLTPSQMMRNLNSDAERQYYRAQKQRSPDSSRPMSAREQLFGSNCYLSPDDEISPQLSPVYQSEAAREIIMEMSGSSIRKNVNRRQVPREKRRHHTVSNIRHVIDSDSHFRMGSARSRDDLDMERALRPRMNAPDVVRSTMNQKDLKYNENTIDNILGTPNKIVIPERYIPEQEPILTAEEQLHRLKKAESIRKMLSETTAVSSPDLSGEGAEEQEKSSTLKKKVEEEKKQREHLLELNQILAQQVMEKSKLVAGSISASSHQQD